MLPIRPRKSLYIWLGTRLVKYYRSSGGARVLLMGGLQKVVRVWRDAPSEILAGGAGSSVKLLLLRVRSFYKLTSFVGTSFIYSLAS